MRRRNLLVLALAVAALAVFAAAALADGELDASFSGDGRTTSDPTLNDESVSDLVIDAQGRFVVVGHASSLSTSRGYVARFTPEGDLDKSFGGDGWELIVWNGEPETAEAVTIDSKGRVVVAGHANVPGNGFDFAAARLTDQGTFDGSFSGDGRATMHILQGGSDIARGVATDAQDRVLVAGIGGTRLAVARFTEAGAADPTFGVDSGSQPIGFPTHEAAGGESIEIDSAGRIVLGGVARTGVQQDFGVVRLLGADGEFDASFGFQGRAILNFGSEVGEQLHDLAIDSAGRYVVVGTNGTAGSNATLIGRLLDNGAPDPSFDGDGKVALSLPESNFAKRVALDPAGRILAVGAIGNNLGQDAALIRLDASGALDPSFGSGGLVREDFLAANASGEGIAVDSQGRYVMAGNATAAGNASKIGLARFLASYPQPAPPAGPPPPPPTVKVRCQGVLATKVGTARRETIRGTKKRDVIAALGGNDTVRALGGNDLVCAGNGKDLVKAGAGNDRVLGGGGADRLFGEAGRDTLLGEAAADRLVGGAGKDKLRGGAGRDRQR